MFKRTHEPLPAHGNPFSAATASALRTWLKSAARRLVDRNRVAAPVTFAPRNCDREAEAVRAMAYTYRVTDRRFADELYAAAERHERAADNWHGRETRPAKGNE